MLRNALHAAMRYRYHRRHRAEAMQILRTVESVKGKTSSRLISQSDEYAQDVLGWQGYAPWLYVYSAVQGEFKDGWLPDNYYGTVVIEKMKGDYGKVCNLKALTHTIFNSRSEFPDLAYYTNELFLSPIYEPILSIQNHLFSRRDRVVFKIDKGEQGKGVYFYDTNTFDVDKIRSLGNGVFQEFIEQHEFFEQFASKSVATVRITTAIDEAGRASARACYLRLGRANDTHVKSASSVKIPVDVETGELHALGYLPDWRSVDRHPDADIVFDGQVLPEFDQCVSTTLELHRLVPFARCIGWDIVVDRRNRVRVMEWNAQHNGIKFSEATQGPCFTNLQWNLLWHDDRARLCHDARTGMVD